MSLGPGRRPLANLIKLAVLRITCCPEGQIILDQGRSKKIAGMFSSLQYKRNYKTQISIPNTYCRFDIISHRNDPNEHK